MENSIASTLSIALTILIIAVGIVILLVYGGKKTFQNIDEKNGENNKDNSEQ